MCAAYDSPSFAAPMFGGGSFPERGQTAHGSDGTLVGQEDAAARVSLGVADLTTPHTSSQAPGDIQHVTVTTGDSQVPGQVPEREPFTGVGNTWRETVGHDDPNGHVSTPYHPNSAGTGR